VTASTQITHTPGPWRVINGTDILALEDTLNSIVVASTQFFSGRPTERQLADAQLVAAAPDLLEAARQFVHYHSQIPSVPVDPDKPFETECVCGDCSRFKAAIAKAEGIS
jgi:hypothetical protein